MDNSQSFNIPLDAPLEVSSEHDLVPATNPTLAYNHQSLVSGLLMNAVKYERDGVFCGKYLYDYDVKYTYKIEGSEFSGLEISHPDPNNPAYNPTLIHPDDVSRNFYWYEEYQKYAVDVSYPNTRRLFNVNFLAGFLKNNILKDVLGYKPKVNRTNADGIDEDGVNDLHWDMVPDNDTFNTQILDGNDKYVITGGTHREHKPFRLLADVYSRQLEDHVETDTGDIDDVRAFIPVQYDASLTFGTDTINCQVVHETRDQDNIAVAMPALLLNETGKELFITDVQKTGNNTDTRLNFDGTNKYIMIPYNNPNLGLGSGLGMQRVEQTRYNSGTVDEYDQIFIKNTDRINRDPDRPNMTTEGTEDLEIMCSEAVIAVESPGGSVPLMNGHGIWTASPSDDMRQISINTGESTLVITITCRVVGAGSGRNPGYGTPTYWQGVQSMPYADIEVAYSVSKSEEIAAKTISWAGGTHAFLTWSIFNGPKPPDFDPTDGGRIPWDNETIQGSDTAGKSIAMSVLTARLNEWIARDYGTVDDLKTSIGQDREGGSAKGVSGLGKSQYWLDYSFVIPKSTVYKPIIMGDGRPLQFRIVCNDIESGDWSIVSKPTGDDPFLVAYDTIVMNEDLVSGVVKLGVSQPQIDMGGSVSVSQRESAKDKNLGIVFNFIPIKVMYINDVRFKRSRRNTVSLSQGDQTIVAQVELQPWDFSDTLTNGDGVTIPNSVNASVPPDFGTPSYIPEPPESALTVVGNPPLPDLSNMPDAIIPDLPSVTYPDPPDPPVAEIPVYQGWTPQVPEPPTPWPTLDSFGQPPAGAVTPPDPLPSEILALSPTSSELPFDWDTLTTSEQDAWLLIWRRNQWMTLIGIPEWQQQQQDQWVLNYKSNWLAEWSVTHPIIAPNQLPAGWDSMTSDQRYMWWRDIYVPGWTLNWQDTWRADWAANDPVASAVINEQLRLVESMSNAAVRAYIEAYQNQWRSDRRQELYNQWKLNYILNWANSEREKWYAANRNVGWIHRQCIWITYKGLSSTETVRKRYVIDLPHWRLSSLTGNTTTSGWLKFRLSYSTAEIQGVVRTTGRLFEMHGELAPSAYKEPSISSDLRVVPGIWRLGYGSQRTDMSNASSGYGSGYSNKTLLYDNTSRRIQVRRGFVVSSNGEMANATVNQMIGPLDAMDVRFNTPLQGLSVLDYDNGSFTFNELVSSPAKYELSYDQDWQRIIQFSNGDWATSGEFMTSTETGMVNLYTYYSSVEGIDPQIVESLLQIIWLLYSGASVNRINKYIDSSVISTWAGLGLVQSVLSSYTGSSSIVSINPDVYRLVFRDADKANFNFFPKGIYTRGNNNIRYLGYSVTYDPIITTEIASAKIMFDYAARNPIEVIEDASVTVYSNDFYGQLGRGYTSVEAHDPQTGEMQAMQLANPDLDYAFITHQFETSLSTEQMFYIDRTHILKCTTRSFILLEYVDEEWIERKVNSRGSVIGSDEEALRYGVTSAVENIPMLWTVTSGVGSVNITLYPLGRFDNDDDPETPFDYFDDYVIRYKKTVTIPLVDATMSGFSSTRMGFIGTPPASTYFVNTITLTSSRVGNYAMIGMVYDKGVNQWTACVNTSTSSKQYFVFNGYGCVGVDGTVTGSAVPMYAMNARSGISVSIRSKPDKDSGFKMNRGAYVSGQSLVFIDSTFNRGICVSAKLKGARFTLKSLPLRFSRHELIKSKSDHNNDLAAKFKFVAVPNFAFIYFVASWAWARSIAGLSINSWVTQHLLDEADIFYEVEKEEKTEGAPPNDFWIKLAIALLMAVAERVGQAASAGIQMALDTKFKRIDGLINAAKTGDLSAAMNQSGGAAGLASSIGSGATDAAALAKSSGITQQQLSNEIQLNQNLDVIGSKNRVVGTMVDLERKTRPSGQLATQVLDEVRDRVIAVANSQSGGNVAAYAIARARLGSSNLYSVGPNQNVWAGPGFTQIHFSQGSRIHGVWSTYKNVVGNGTMFVPRLPPIPLPYIGPLDINNDGVVGIHPIADFAPIIEPDIGMQPNFNVGSKHIVYSYPIKDVQDHEINQTMLAPQLDVKRELLYESEYKSREWDKHTLKFIQWNESELVVDNCSIIQGVDSYHSGDEELKIPILVDSGYANFATPGTFDYCVYPPAELYYSATAGQVTGVSIRDTLVLDGAPSNVVILNGMPLIASAYTCIEAVRTLTKDTIRPKVFSGDTLLFPMTGFNVIKGLQVLHGCDGYTNRIAKLVGVTAVDGEIVNTIHTHVRQGNVKTGGIWPGISYMGKFDMVPQIDTYLQPVDIFTSYLNNVGLSRENLYGYRYSIPVVHKTLGLLPAAIQTLAPYKVHVIDGVTSLTTDLRTTESRNRADEAYDFVIYGNPFRVNGEYIAKLNAAQGTVALEDAVATLGLRYVGSTPQQAWFYTNITNSFYTFTMSNPTIGATSMESVGSAFRFKDVETGTWDFVAQEVAFKTLMDRDIDIRHDHYKDIVRVKDGFLGTIAPPNANTVAKYGYFDLDSTANGVAMRGKHRSQVNMFVWHDYMFREEITSENVLYGIPGYDRFNGRVNDGIVVNHGLWDKIRGDKLIDFYTDRNYDWDRYDKIYGYFLEPFKLETSFLGLSNDVDCLFEWEITFALTPMMRRLLRDKFVTIHIAAETQVPNGGIYSPVTHLYLTEEHFGRTRIDGAAITSETRTSYYSFRFNARNGAGSCERLFIWSDGCCAIKSPIKLMCAPITEQRSQPLITRVDVTGLKEL